MTAADIDAPLPRTRADLRPVLTEAIANQGSSQKTEKNRTLRAEAGPLAAMQSCDQRAGTIAMVRVALSH